MSRLASRLQQFPAFCARLARRASWEAWKNNSSRRDSLYLLDPDGHRLEIHAGNLARLPQTATLRRVGICSTEPDSALLGTKMVVTIAACPSTPCASRMLGPTQSTSSRDPIMPLPPCVAAFRLAAPAPTAHLERPTAGSGTACRNADGLRGRH